MSRQQRCGRRPLLAASGWTGGRIAAVAIGVLLVLVALALLGAGGTALWADRTQRDGGYVTTGVHDFSTAGSALATVSTELGSAGIGWMYSPGLLDEVRIRVRRRVPAQGCSWGSALRERRSLPRRGEPHRHHRVLGREVETVTGGQAEIRSYDTELLGRFLHGLRSRTLEWEPTDGSWTVVVMNADGRPGIDVGADLGARMPAVLWVAVGLAVAGGWFLAGGVLLIAGAIRGGRQPSEYGGDRRKEDGTMQNIKEAASEFLAKKRVAVTGVSRPPETHGSNNVYRRLRERGYDVFAVNPNADEVEGDRCCEGSDVHSGVVSTP